MAGRSVFEEAVGKGNVLGIRCLERKERRTMADDFSDGSGKGWGLSGPGLGRRSFFSLYTCCFYSLLFFPLLACLFSRFFSFKKKYQSWKWGVTFVRNPGFACFFPCFFFPSAFTAPFSFFLIFNSCIYPCLLLFDLSGVLKNVFACLFHISFLTHFPFLIPFTHTKTPAIIISLLLRIFFAIRSFFFSFSFPLQLTFTTIDMSLFSRTLKECG